jgi:hypothetical protein
MIKLLAVGLWVCAVTLASGYAAVTWQAGRSPEPEAEKFFGGLDYVKTKMISVPVIADGAVQGYVIAQFVFTIDASLLKKLSIKPDVFLVDEAIRTIYAGEGFDFRQMKKHDLPVLSKAIADSVNARFGARFVEEVLIQDLNYLPKDQIRAGRANL